MAQEDSVALIILNWNGYRDTKECLFTVFSSKLKSINLTTYLVDNDSSDNSPAKLKKIFPQVVYLENPKNLGYATGNNVGINHALSQNHRYLILLNNDTALHPDTLSNLVSAAKHHRFDLGSPKIYFYPGREYHFNSYQKADRGKVLWYAGGWIDWPNVILTHRGVNEIDQGQWDKPETTDFATGCCLLIKREVVESIGALDPAYIAYYEDADYSLRAKRAGFKVGYLPNSHLWHKNAGSTGGSGSAQQRRHVDRSRLVFARRWASPRAKLSLAKNHILSLVKKPR